ncbi:MAG: phosphate signaling complex protein PhoU [Candidatus Aureabacteria bacterium]|nr:phosphate signaling complex protein PhoU [Candidatus Auribacterota bacterium]
MHRHFDDELQGLNQELIKMSEMVKTAINHSVTALDQRDRQMAEEVISKDNEIDLMEIHIDEVCIDLIAKHQPMASDLRLITTGMKINADLERMADLAVNICQRVLEIVNQDPITPPADISKLSLMAENMINDSITAFIESNLQMAKQVMTSDDQADKLRNDIKEDLLKNYMEKDPSTSRRAVALLLITRHLERICDHATYVAEEVIYLMKGKIVKHHFQELP